MNTFFVRISFAAALLLTAMRAIAAPIGEWTLTTEDFRSERVALVSIDARGIKVSGADGSRRVDFDHFLQLERSALQPDAPGAFVVELIDGDRLIGEPASTEGETVVWNSRALGSMKLPMRRIASIGRIGAESSIALPDQQRRLEDRVILSNGDSVGGVITSISGGSVSIQPAGGGDATTVPLDSIAAITFAATVNSGGAPADMGRRFRVTLTDGTTVTSPSPSFAGAKLSLGDGAGGNALAPIALDGVARIEQVNGPVLWLSSLTPTETVQTPFFEMSWPARMNLSVTGEPLRFGGQTFARGIGVHSYSRLSWAIDPSVRAFRTQYAIDGQQPYADVTVRIKLNGKVAYEQSQVRSGKLWPVLQLETGGARTITLEVDYGENGDVQDRFNWIEPALLRYKPAPATNPMTSQATNPVTRPG